jgi:hypothetical protein
MLNIALQPGDLQAILNPLNFSSAEAQSSPLKNVTHISPGGNKPFSVFLRPGNAWYSFGNTVRLVLQATDGNLVLQVVDDFNVAAAIPFFGGAGPQISPNEQIWVPVWSPGIQNRGVTEVDFQIDGNLVAYAGSHPVWNSGTSGHENAILVVGDDGNMVIYEQGNIAVFATNTSMNESPGRNA